MHRFSCAVERHGFLLARVLTSRFLQQKAGEYALPLIDVPPMQCGAGPYLEAPKAEIEEGQKAMKPSSD
jgi:hypothetical protein